MVWGPPNHYTHYNIDGVCMVVFCFCTVYNVCNVSNVYDMWDPPKQYKHYDIVCVCVFCAFIVFVFITPLMFYNAYNVDNVLGPSRAL